MSEPLVPFQPTSTEVHSSTPVRQPGDAVIACILAMNDVRHDRGQASMPYPSSHFFAAFLGALKARGFEVRPVEQETGNATD